MGTSIPGLHLHELPDDAKLKADVVDGQYQTIYVEVEPEILFKKIEMQAKMEEMQKHFFSETKNWVW